MYLSVNVYKIIAIIVLIPPCDDDARKRKSNGRVACENRGEKGGGRGQGDGKPARVAGRMKY